MPPQGTILSFLRAELRDLIRVVFKKGKFVLVLSGPRLAGIGWRKAPKDLVVLRDLGVRRPPLQEAARRASPWT